MTFLEYYMTPKNDKCIVVFSGKFQPWHGGHKISYDQLVDKFGKKNTYIATSDKNDDAVHPFNFEEKKKIITTMFPDIDSSKIIQVKSPYAPKEILEKFPTDTVYVTALGHKNRDRLDSGEYFEDFGEDKDMNGYKDNGYIFIMKDNDKYIDDEKLTGTAIRNVFRTDDEEKKRRVFEIIYPQFNEEIFDLLNTKIGGQDE